MTVPEEALKEATEAYWCAYHSGVPHEEIPRVAIQAAEAGIRADERARIIAHLETLAKGADHGGAAFRMFTTRHTRLAGHSGPSALLSALADEIRRRYHEGGDDGRDLIALDALAGAGMVVVPAEDLRTVLDEEPDGSQEFRDASARLRAALPEENNDGR